MHGPSEKILFENPFLKHYIKDKHLNQDKDFCAENNSQQTLKSRSQSFGLVDISG
jgi:hypothetical protein